VAQVREAQLRLLYSLLKPVVRAAARFHIPMRTVSELVRLAYFEHLQREGLTQADIAKRFGQTDRHMRSLAKRLKSDFFAAEHDVGVVREIENLVAAARPRPDEIAVKVPEIEPAELDRAMTVLATEGRIELAEDGRLQAPARYHVLSSDQFHHRVDALNHFLDGMYRAVLHRLVFDDRQGSMVKAISFTALPSSLQAFVARFEGELRRNIAALEEEAQFQGKTDARYTMGVTLAPIDER
jgi:transcriptional regulator